jgi:hypothetical protein
VSNWQSVCRLSSKSPARMYLLLYSGSNEGADRSGGPVDGSGNGGLEAGPKSDGGGDTQASA